MRLSTLWGIVHAWNDNRKHRSCMVVKADTDLDPYALVIDFAHAAATGGLITLDEARKQPQPQETQP